MAEQSPVEQPLRKKSPRAANTHTYLFKISLLERHQAVGSVSLGLTARTNQREPEESGQLWGWEVDQERAVDSSSLERTKG